MEVLLLANKSALKVEAITYLYVKKLVLVILQIAMTVVLQYKKNFVLIMG